MKNVQSSLSGETHNQYRNRVGRISRHQHLMSQKVEPSTRREEIERLSEASNRIEKKVEKEIEEFLENLTQAQFTSIQKFFASMPKLTLNVKITHPKTKKKGTVKLQGLRSFF